MRRNPYKPLSVEEKLKLENKDKEIESKLKAIAESAKICLDNPVFKVYKDKLIAGRELVIKSMKENTESDPVKYAFFMKACITRIDTLDMLLEVVEKDARKK